MSRQRANVLTMAERCKNILVANWQGSFNTIKVDASGSKQEIHSSRVKYLLRKGKPYIWVPEDDLHNAKDLLGSEFENRDWMSYLNKIKGDNVVIDERTSFAVASPFPGPLAHILKSIKKFPARVALTGEVVPLHDEKVSSAMDNLRKVIISEQESFAESSYAVSGILSSSAFGSTSRSENLLEILDTDESYMIYKLEISSCKFIDANGGAHVVEPDELAMSKADKLSPFATKLIDGINQSEVRRRALVIFCFAFMNTRVKDAYMLSIDRKGFEVLGKVANPRGGFLWKEFRFALKDEAHDAESFCEQLVEMEEEALKSVKTYSGL